jgi:hypothetical protein
MGILDFLFQRRRSAVTQRSSVTRPTAPPAVDWRTARRERRDLEWQRALQSIEHPFELVPGAQAEAAYEAARALGRTQNFSALILQPGFGGPVSTHPSSLQDSEVGAADEYFERRAQTLAEDTDELALFDHVNEVEPQAAQGLSMVDMLSETQPLSPYTEVAILRLPCAESWKIPLFVPIGGPSDQSERSDGEEIDIQRQWHDRFGAELCCVGERSWQFRVARPPRSHDEAVELLRQHYLYEWMWDSYGEETIENGVAALRTGTHWMFFWL